MEFRKEFFVNLNIWACKRKHAKHQYCRISNFVVQKLMRARSISKYHFQHRYRMHALESLSLSLSLSLSHSLVWIQNISDVLPNQIRGNRHTKNQSCKRTSDFASDASKEYTCNKFMSRDMRFPTMWYVGPAKPQISLRICTV